MKKSLTPLITILAIVCTASAYSSWAPNPDTGLPIPIFSDTVPVKAGTQRDFDKELEAINKGEEQMKKFNEEEFDKMVENIEKSIKDLDIEKMIAKVDIDKAMQEAQQSLQKIDLAKMEKEIENQRLTEEERKSIKEEIEKARIEMKKAMEEIKNIKKPDQAELKKQMEKIKLDMEKTRKEMLDEKGKIRQEIRNAAGQMQEARKEIKGFQEMVYSMEDEGLLSTKTDYTIEFKNNSITINGKALSEEQNSRYRKYFDKPTTIKKKDGDINIQKDK